MTSSFPFHLPSGSCDVSIIIEPGEDVVRTDLRWSSNLTPLLRAGSSLPKGVPNKCLPNPTLKTSNLYLTNGSTEAKKSLWAKVGWGADPKVLPLPGGHCELWHFNIKGQVTTSCTKALKRDSHKHTLEKVPPLNIQEKGEAKTYCMYLPFPFLPLPPSSDNKFIFSRKLRGTGNSILMVFLTCRTAWSGSCWDLL